jgi:hypothetical protein
MPGILERAKGPATLKKRVIFPTPPPWLETSVNHV